ncbi:uncharacterized protein LOC143365448 [Halictus rubicundus]|uniref:uncharacterized protein LOC143365448 n=1 Tax=Halictus rubicundus TaxID=77578 RepID=UPI00403571ED
MFNLLYLKTSYTRINVINKLQFVYQGIRGNSKFKVCVFPKLYHTSPNRTIKITNSRFKESVEQSKADIDFINTNTNVQNNVLLYRLETNYFQFMRYFSIGALTVSAFIMYMTYDPKLTLLFTTNISLKEYLKCNGFSIIYFVYGGLMGPLICWALYLSASRYIKYIILHKGGQEVSIITYHLYKDQIVLRIPLNEVQSTIARKDMKNYMPMKVKGKRFFYLLDFSGKFLNGRLFDNTIGTEKIWRK